MINRSRIPGYAALALGLACAIAVWAADSQETAKGNGLYRVYCSNCHGATGKGDGKLSNLLKVKVPDLTVLAKKNHGEFDADTVQSYIDGREDVAAHGDREMPVWGMSFQQPDKTEPQEADVKAHLRALVGYLETLQAQ